MIWSSRWFGPEWDSVMRNIEHKCRKVPLHGGLTLLELLIAVSIFALLMGVVTLLLYSAAAAYGAERDRLSVQQQAAVIMARLVAVIRDTSVVMVPNAHNPATTYLIVSACIDNDNDGRYDEDLGGDMTADGKPGVAGVNDDDDWMTDEGFRDDDDEDGPKDEDLWNGFDDDGDGMIDEDVKADMNGDGEPGLSGVDDDGDGHTDESAGGGHSEEDDDEDGYKNEDPLDPLFFVYSEGAGTLSSHLAGGPSEVWSEEVTFFQVEYLGLQGGSDPLYRVTLELTGSSGFRVRLATKVMHRNATQRYGQRIARIAYPGG